MNSQEFYKTYYPVAVKVSNYMDSDKRISPEVILAALSWESNFGTNRGAKELNNVAGIKYTPYAAKVGATQSGMYANYPSLDAFAKDMARVLNLSYYKGIHAAAKTPGYKDDIEAWNKSPYAEDDYNVSTILSRINEINQIKGTTAVETLQGNTITLQKPNLANMGQSDVQKYALIGFLVVGLLALTSE